MGLLFQILFAFYFLISLSKADDGKTAIHLAVEKKDLKLLRNLLINDTSSVHLRNHYGHTALHLASRYGCWECVKLLVIFGADVNTATWRKTTPLHLWSIHAEAPDDAVQFLVSKGADINVREGQGETPLHVAIKSGNEAFLDSLIHAGADFDLTNINGSTILHYATQKNTTVILDRILEGVRGKKKTELIDIRDRFGMTALHRACQEGKYEMVMSLLKSGANMSLQDYEGRTSLHIACEQGRVDIIAAILMQQLRDNQWKLGEFLRSRDFTGNIPLHAVSNSGDVTATVLLLTLTDYSDQTLASLTAEGLIQQGRAIAERYTQGLRTNRVAASEFPNRDMVQSRNINGWTPLVEAAMKGNAEVIKILLSAGADIWAIGSEGQTALTYTCLVECDAGAVAIFDVMKLEAEHQGEQHMIEAALSKDSSTQLSDHRASVADQADVICGRTEKKRTLFIVRVALFATTIISGTIAYMGYFGRMVRGKASSADSAHEKEE